MPQLLAQSVSWTVFALVAYGLSKLLRCRLDSDRGAPKTRSAWLPLAPVAVTLLGLIALALWAPRPEGMPFGLRLTFWRSVGFLVNVLPAGWAMYHAGEPIRSAGLGRHNLWQACVIGLALGGLWCLPGALGQKLARPLFGGWAGWLLFMAMVGFGEEFLFRGYLQTRLISRLGTWRGWVLASLLFAASHVPRYLFADGLGPGAAMVAAALLVPSGLAMGFIMFRTQNLLAPAIFHTITNF